MNDTMKKVSFSIALIALFGLLLAVIGIIDENQRTKFADYWGGNSLYFNWNQQPLLDLFLSDTPSCITGYSVLSLGKSPATLEGCKCENITQDSVINPDNGLKNVTCTSEQISNQKCRVIQPVNATDILKWRESYFCVKYLNFSYKQMDLVSKDNDCPFYQKNCGSVDSFENKLCLNNTYQCPLNFIAIVDADTVIYDNFNYKKLTFKDGLKSLVISSTAPETNLYGNVNTRLISSLSINRGVKCALPNEFSLPKSMEYDLYEENNYNECNTHFLMNTPNITPTEIKYNPYYFALDSESGLKVIDSNTTAQLLSLPDFSQGLLNSSDSYTIGISNYVGMDVKCKITKENIDVKDELRSDFENFINSHKTVNYCCIPVIISLVILPIALFFNDKSNKKSLAKEILLNIGLILLIVGSLILLVISWYIYSSISKPFDMTLIYEVSSTDSNKCSDTYTNSLIDYYSILFTAIKNKYIAAVIIIIIVFLSGPIFIHFLFNLIDHIDD